MVQGVDGKTYVSTTGINISGTTSSNANYYGTNGSTVYTISADLTTFTNNNINLGGGGNNTSFFNGGNGLLNSANNITINHLGAFLGGGGGSRGGGFGGGFGGAGGGGGGAGANGNSGGSIIGGLNGSGLGGGGGPAGNGNLGGGGLYLGTGTNSATTTSGGNGIGAYAAGGYGGGNGGGNGGGGGGGGNGTGNGNGGYGIQNNGSITNLVNLQGSSVPTTQATAQTAPYLYGPLFFAGNAPDSYTMLITNENTFGQLWCTGVGNTGSTQTIYNFSVGEFDFAIPVGSYTLENVLRNVTVPLVDGLLPSGSSTGTYDYTWSLIPATSLEANAYDLLLNVTATCFLKGTKILTNMGYINIEDLNKDEHLVETFLYGLKKILIIGNNEIYHSANNNRIKDQLYKYENNELGDLIITGGHSVLVNELNEEEYEKSKKYFGLEIPKIDGLYRLLACVDEKASVYETAGKYTIYHLALENEKEEEAYGIYANGILVESCSEKYMKEHSGMNM